MFIIAFGTFKIYAKAEPEVYEEMLSDLDFNEMNGIIDKTGGLQNGDGFLDTAVKAIKGELDLSLSGIASALLEAMFREVKAFSGLMKELLAVALLSAVLGALSGGLRVKSVGELGFYVCYIITVTLVLSSFADCMTVLGDFTGELCKLVIAAAPLMAGTLLASGNPSAAAVFNPAAMFAAGGLELIIRDIATPLLIFSAILKVVGNIAGGDTLGRLSELLKKCVSIGLKVLAGLFVGILSLQRASVPIIDNAAVKTAKFAVNAIPAVGQALTGAVDAVVYWSGAVKNGVMIAVIIAIFFMCLPAVLKMAAFVIIYKLTAALAQPICDKRVISAVDGAGSLAAVALGAAALSAVVFIFMMMIMISI
ncbi:MAG: stage III sporulation protein AE [Clostridiales bacterium]|nr:stage III sporulation protein AE [Clostridiales bacterium]